MGLQQPSRNPRDIKEPQRKARKAGAGRPAPSWITDGNVGLLLLACADSSQAGPPVPSCTSWDAGATSLPTFCTVVSCELADSEVERAGGGRQGGMESRDS